MKHHPNATEQDENLVSQRKKKKLNETKNIVSGKAPFFSTENYWHFSFFKFFFFLGFRRPRPVSLNSFST